MRILLVDDDLVFAKLVVNKLAELGLRGVTVAHSAEEAIDLLDQRTSPFDCFLLDIFLGDTDGINLCHILRQRPENKLVPIIMVTSQRDNSLMSRAFSAGATDFLRKPLDHNELVGRIKTAMLLVELAKKAKAPPRLSEILPHHKYTADEPPAPKSVFIPKIKCMVNFSCFRKQLSEMRSRNETPKLYRAHIKDFGRLVERVGDHELKPQLHKLGSLLSDELGGDKILISYLGRGRFIMCVQNQGPNNAGEDAVSLQNRANLRLGGSQSAESMVLQLRISDIAGPFLPSPKATTHDLLGEHSINLDALARDLPKVDDIEETMFEKALIEEKGG